MSRTAVVTRGTRGIGAAIARALHVEGYKVAANYAGNDAAAAAFNGETGIAVFKWDVSDFGACKAGICCLDQGAQRPAAYSSPNNSGYRDNGIMNGTV
jgi:acetoacetyl-CoA reductase